MCIRDRANLIDNAVRHGGGGADAGRGVEVTAESETDDDGSPRTVIRVIDHGSGIPADRRGQIFDAFVQGGDRNGADGGVGLGLSVAQGFTAAIGGTLGVEETPGGGTTMVVSLPAEDDES